MLLLIWILWTLIFTFSPPNQILLLLHRDSHESYLVLMKNWSNQMRNRQFHVESLDYWSSWCLEFPNVGLIYEPFLAPPFPVNRQLEKQKSSKTFPDLKQLRFDDFMIWGHCAVDDEEGHWLSPCVLQQRWSVQTLAWFPAHSACPCWWFERRGLRRCHTPSPDRASWCSPTPRRVALHWGGTASPCSWSLMMPPSGSSYPCAACPRFWQPLALTEEEGEHTCQANNRVKSKNKDRRILSELNLWHKRKMIIVQVMWCNKTIYPAHIS